jgi:hypothetical protein
LHQIALKRNSGTQGKLDEAQSKKIMSIISSGLYWATKIVNLPEQRKHHSISWEGA